MTSHNDLINSTAHAAVKTFDSCAAIFARLIVFSGVFLVSPLTNASSGFARIIETHPASRINYTGEKCLDLFTRAGPMQVVETMMTFQDGTFAPSTQTRFTSDSRSAKIDPVVAKALDNWVSGRDYTPEQAEMLRQRDRNLDPRRTSYIHLETDGKPAIVRIFDGSTRVLKGGSEWEDASFSSAETPIEIGKPGYVLPERYWAQRTPGKQAYIWEIGLLDISRQLDSGVETIFNGVAKLLDLHYNNKDFDHFRETKALEEKSMMIYAQVRKNRVGIFRKYGFQPLLTATPEGVVSEFEISENLVLISIKAEDFLRRFQNPKTFARAKNGKNIYNDEALERNNRKMREHLIRANSARLPSNSFADLQREAMSVFQVYMQARMMMGKTELRRNMTVDFFERYLRIINSIPEQLRHNDWINLRNLVLEMMGQNNPYDALFYFSSSMDQLGSKSKVVVDEQAYQAFLVNPPGALHLIIPTNPFMNLTFTPN